MMKAKVATAAKMLAGQSGVVLCIEGGHVLIGRLESLGIRPGKRIRKVSSGFMKGPSVIEVDGCDIAIGYGMADRILTKMD
jgi:Fe2+ transport system protein FeoA